MKIDQQFRTALVTGASSGLGLVFAHMLVAEGLSVTATSRDGTRLPDGVRPVALDLSQPHGVAEFLARYDAEAPDLLINNAGYAIFADFARLPVEECDRMTRVLLGGPAELCRAFYPIMQERGRGAIVNVSSIAAVLPIPYMSLYNAGKAGLSQFSRSLMLESEGSGVAVIDLQLGDFATGFNTAMAERKTVEPALTPIWEKIEKYLREGPPPDVAARRLQQILRNPKSGVYTAGSFFQTKIAPLFARFSSSSMQRFALRRYYNCSRRRDSLCSGDAQ